MANADIQCYMYLDEDWVEYTNNLTTFHVEDQNLSRVPTATITMEGLRSTFTDYIAAPYTLARLQIKPGSSYYSIFYGYIHHPTLKKIAGTLDDKVKFKLDLVGGAQRLATDYITYDYYGLQSAVSPNTSGTWTYRQMIQDFLDHPDSTFDGTGLSGTGFSLVADTKSDGIDAAIDASCSWNGNTLLEALRTVADRIGYDGYITVSDGTYIPVIGMHPISNSDTSIATLTDPFVDEPEYDFGDINDVSNVIFVHGGIDAGIPSDGDRLTARPRIEDNRASSREGKRS